MQGSVSLHVKPYARNYLKLSFFSLTHVVSCPSFLLLLPYCYFLYTCYTSCFCVISLPYSFAYNLPLLFAVFIQCFPSSPPPVTLLVYLHSHSPSISLHPPPVGPLPLVFFLHPVLLRSPLPSTLTASCLIKAPPKKLDRSDQLTTVSPSALTWVGQHTNKWEWLSSDIKHFWYLWKWLFHMEGHIWCECLLLTETFLNANCSK